MFKKRRGVTGAAGAATLAIVLAACGGGSGGSTSGNNNGGGQETANAVKGGTLNMLGSGDVDYMDPNITYYSIGYLGARMWTRQLYSNPADPQNATKAVPDLADGDPQVSSDGLTVTVKLRQGPMWNTSPARPVTAQDVVRGIKRTCNPVQPFGGLPDFMTLFVGFKDYCDGFAKVPQKVGPIKDYITSHNIPGIQAKDDHTVVFKLTHPAAYLKDMLTMAAFSPAPKEFLNYLPASAELAQHTISDGPYQIESYNPTKKIVFTRNPAWKASSDPIRKAYVDKIVVDETVSQESTQQQLETGQPNADMEWDNFVPPSQLPGLMAKNDPNLNLGDTASSNPYIVFNTVSPNNNDAMKKLKVRKALEYALNRSHLVQSLGGPKVSPPLTHVLPPSLLGGEQDFNLYPYSVDKAKKLLADAGYPNGLTLKFLYRNASEGSRKSFATVQQDLRQVGINVQGVPVPNADFYTKYLEVPDVAKRGVWDLSLAGWGADWYGNGALSYFAPLFSGPPSYPPNGSNFGFYNSDQANQLIQQATNAKSEDQAKTLWHQADEQVMKDAAFFPITNPKQPNYHASQVHNAIYLPTIQNFDPTNVWISKDKQG